MAIDKSQPARVPEKEHRFIPAAFGLLSGAIASVFTARKIVQAKLQQWVLEKIHYSDDPSAKSAIKQIEDEIAHIKENPENARKLMNDEVKHLRLTEMSLKLDKLEKKLKAKLAEKLKVTEAEARADVEHTIAGELKSHILRNPKLTEEEIKAVEKRLSFDKIKRIEDVYNKFKQPVERNYTYFFNRAKAKEVIYPEVIDRMGLHLRMVEGRKWAFIGGSVALGVVGYAGYKLADVILNGKGGNHSQALINRRINSENQSITTTSII